MAMREAVAICKDLGWTEQDRSEDGNALFEKALVTARNGIIRGMMIADHEAVSRLSKWVGK